MSVGFGGEDEISADLSLSGARSVQSMEGSIASNFRLVFSGCTDGSPSAVVEAVAPSVFSGVLQSILSFYLFIFSFELGVLRT